MLANVPSTSTSTSTSSAVDVAAATAAASCDDERTRLLGSTTPTSTSPPTSLSLPLVHTTMHPSRQPQQQQQQEQNQNQNESMNINNNNNDNNDQHQLLLTESSTNNNYNNNDSNRSDIEDLSEETTTTVGAADSSDQSDKFNRPPTTATNQKKPKLSKLGTKSVGLKRVSFGSSKGSMVETLVFETPTPLSEHVEPSFGFDAADAAGQSQHALNCAAVASGTATTITAAAPATLNSNNGSSYGDYAKLNMDDSGIEVQEESERSIVRVSIYQSSQPQQICPPSNDYSLTSFADNLDNTFSSYNCNLDYTTMATATMQPTVGLGPAYDRQQSTDSGWDNPFRPGGDLSREADEIVSMIRGGKPITPTEDRTIGNGNAQHGDDNCNGATTAIGESVTKTNLSQNQATAQNGTNSHGSKVEGSTGGVGGAAGGKSTAATAGNGKGGGGGGGEGNNGVTSLAQVSKQVVPGPTSASHVVIDEKKNKKKGCCVVQ
ncbi:hypothetical protein KR093_004410 [Drosophila rubida]|uniref:Uncharacterized protein n=1 Tax=Drosophila rubida TaxID=30044 RepID=A0AAD4KAM4_9MUSC|nr:hypothetical protein KR093_004410 [Drosophila rubida]